MSEREELNDLYFKALELNEKGDFAGALDLFMRGSALGDDGAQNAVGMAYDSGAGVEKDKDKAIAWFKKAWRTGRQSSWCENIALTYAEMGRHRQAMYWWRKAIAMGDGDAAIDLAKYLLKSKRRKTRNRILDLLRMAANCQESWQITPAGKEEAQELLEKLTSKSQ